MSYQKVVDYNLSRQVASFSQGKNSDSSLSALVALLAILAVVFVINGFFVL